MSKNNNIMLPTSGSTNWGGGLNAYIESLNNRISDLEALHIKESNSSSDTIVNMGFPSTGLIGEASIEYDKSSSIVSFNGGVYIGGNVNIYFRNVKYEESISDKITSDKYYFIFLKYYQGEWGFECYSEFKIDDSYILIGLLYKDSFVPYYYASAKNIPNHQYELAHPWIDLNNANIEIHIDSNGHPVTNLQANHINVTGYYDVYCGGLGLKNVRPSSLIPDGKITVSVTAGINSIIMIEDRQDNGTLASTILSSGGNFTATIGEGCYYRLLLDVFGNLIIQKSLEKSLFEDTSGYWCEQQLYNTKFANLINFDAGLCVEIARFGYNYGLVTSLSYDQSDFTNGLAEFHFVKALDHLTNQYRSNIWLTKDSEIWLDKVKFKNSSLVQNSFTFNQVGSNKKADTVKVTVNVDNALQYDNTATFYNVVGDDLKEYKLFKTITLPYSPDSLVSFSSDIYPTKTTTFSDIRTTPLRQAIYDTTGVFYKGDFIVSASGIEDNSITFTVYGYWDGRGDNFTEEEISTHWKYNHWIVYFDIYYDQPNTDVITFNMNDCPDASNSVLWSSTKTDNKLHLESSNDIDIIGDNISLQFSNEAMIEGKNTALQSTSVTTLRGSEIHSVSTDFVVNSTHISLGTWMTTSISMDAAEITTVNNNLTIGSVAKFENEGISFNTDLNLLNGAQLIVTSDKRLKDNINEIPLRYSSVIEQVPVVSFNYKNSNQKHIGIIAQDLKKALSDNVDSFIKTVPDPSLGEKLTLAETKLVYILWKALQEEIEARRQLDKKLTALLKEMNYESNN